MVMLYRICSWLGATLVLLSMASVQSLYSTYTREMPQVPQVQSGRTVSMGVLYGKTVYVTEGESYRLYAREAGVVGAVGLTVLMYQLRRRADRKRNKLDSASAVT
jgi:uncharacterized membrane protein